jgi:hypothetical protein
MGQILRGVHTEIIVSSIIIRHTRDSLNRNGLQSRLEDAIVSTLMQPTPKIYVHWGVYESGKSRAGVNAAVRLQGEHGKLVMLRHGWDFTHKKTFRDWLLSSIGIPDDRADDKLSMFLPKNRTVLILDHPLFLIKQHGAKGVVDGLRELEIPALILVQSWERAVELKKAGCELLGEPGLGSWTASELAELFETFSHTIQDISPDLKDELHQCAVLSGSPGILFNECHREENRKPNMLRAKLMCNEWGNGIRALNGEDMGTTTGRFPDKDGTFHWDKQEQ